MVDGGARNHTRSEEDGARLPPVLRTTTGEEKEGRSGGRSRPDRQPEKKLDGILLWYAAFFRLMNGFGTLAFVWATVVLLGGFSTLIKQNDFWLVTAIVFMQASRVFGYVQKPEDKIFLRLPLQWSYGEKRRPSSGQRIWWRHVLTNKQPSQDTRKDTRFTDQMVRAFIILKDISKDILRDQFKITIYQAAATLMEIIALSVCMTICVMRLSEQDYVDRKYQGRDDHKNIGMSLNMFYGLAMAHSISYYMLKVAFAVVASPVVIGVCSEYGLGKEWASDALHYYAARKVWTIINCSDREALEMDLVTFATGLVRSDSVADQLQGVRVLDYIIRWEISSKQLLGSGLHYCAYQNKEKYRGRALTSIRASTETLEKLVNMLGLNISCLEEQQKRGHAASVMLELAPYLLLENLPGVLQNISSLITTGRERIRGSTNDLNSVEFTWYGVKILERLVINSDNCKSVADADVLLSKIIELTNFSDDCETLIPEIENGLQEIVKISQEIVETSLKVLHKLVSTPGDTGEKLRCTISKNIEILRNIGKILDHDENTNLQAHAVGIISWLAIHEAAREMIGNSCQIIRKLVLLLPRPMDIAQEFTDRNTTADTGVLALVLLSAGSDNNKAAILDEIKLEELVIMLSDVSVDQRSMVAQLLKHLRSYSGVCYADQLKKVVDSSLPKILDAIKVAVQNFNNPELPDGPPSHGLKELTAEEGKLVESFIGLSIQICHSSEASDFDKSLQSANLTMDTYAQMLEMILSVCKSPTTNFPGIRRAVINQMNWMMQSNKDYIEVFMRYEMDKALKEVAETATELENFDLFYNGTGVGKQDELSSVVRLSLALLAGH